MWMVAACPPNPSFSSNPSDVFRKALFSADNFCWTLVLRLLRCTCVHMCTNCLPTGGLVCKAGAYYLTCGGGCCGLFVVGARLVTHRFQIFALLLLRVACACACACALCGIGLRGPGPPHPGEGMERATPSNLLPECDADRCTCCDDDADADADADTDVTIH